MYVSKLGLGTKFCALVAKDINRFIQRKKKICPNLVIDWMAL